ncbi:GNAT family N-acetyltransferase [Oceanobacillus kimchii]|uniref:GNAT family N-acetyltransferase n=1 Tax=Oceanobacillus kimchii TaxID=746691 RepID=UPI00232F60DD|nr:GNAT family N-acetyltransferase [Oceanobacillus kimchii]
MKEQYMITHEPPNPVDYNNLRLEGGMSGKSREASEEGLKNSLFVVCVYDEETFIGMGRVIGDGGTFFQVVDIVVKPGYQGQGLGKLIMEHIMNFLEKHTYPDSYVSLIADGSADKLYKQFGFSYTYPKSRGMYRKY